MGERFRKLGLHASGGIGEVFLAHDEQLSRKVALKVLQERYAEDCEAQQRFVLEGEITGNLEHPGIVPIYSLGHGADTRPFYTMRFIRGDSLREAIRRSHETINGQAILSRNSIELRRLLARFLDICNAIEYAHNRGVIHRDLKPENVMVGNYGETLVVDWGMARILGSDDPESTTVIEGVIRPTALSGSAKTVLGSAMGTPAYMSPEQAEGRHDELTATSDVYSLGGILFCLLTNRAPIERKSALEAIEKVKRGEIPNPRKVKPQVPAALDAICAKAMAFRAADRYQSSQQLAADIERWLSDEPVTAYAEPLTETVMRWFRRHRSWAIATAGALILVAAVSSLAALLISRSAERERIARQGESVARAEALQRFADARRSVDVWLTGFSEALEHYPNVQAFREQMLQRAARDYEEFAEKQSGDPQVNLERGRAYIRLGDVRAMLLDGSSAAAAYRKAIGIFEQLATSEIGSDASVDLADSFVRLAVLQGRSKNYSDAEQNSIDAVTLLEIASRGKPPNPRALGSLVHALTTLGTLRIEARRIDDAEQPLRRAIELQEAVVRASPNEFAYREALAGARLATGQVYIARGDIPAALREMDQAIEVWDQLAQLQQDNPKSYESRAAARIHQATAFRLLGNYDAENNAYEAAIADYQQLIQALPDLPVHQENYALALTDRGQLLFELGRPAEAIDGLTQARDVLIPLAGDYPSVLRFQEELAVCFDNLGESLVDLARFNEAVFAHDVAVDGFERLVTSMPENSSLAERLAVAHSHLAHALQRNEQIERAQKSYRTAIEQLDALISDNNVNHSTTKTLAIVWGRYGDLLRAIGQTENAHQAYTAARDRWAEVIDRWPIVEYLQRGAWFHVICPDESIRNPDLAVQWARRALNATPQNVSYRGALAAALFRNEDFSEASLLLTEALATPSGSRGRDLLVQSMCQHRLGNADSARQFFQEAVTWVDQNRPGNFELDLLRREAETLHGKPNE
jgi:serine/threonine-protein kinase